MAFSLRSLLQKLQGGVDAIRKPLPPPVVIKPTEKQLQSPRVQNAYNQSQPYIKEAQQAYQKAQPLNVIRNAPAELPRFNFAEKYKNPVSKFVATIPQEILNAPRDVFAGSLGLGANIADVAYGKKPVNPLRNIGTIGAGLVNAYAPGPVKQLANQAGKVGLRGLVKQGAVQGAKLGGLGGAFYGMQEGNNVKEQLKNAVKSGAIGAAGGAVVGGALPAVSNAFKKGKISAGMSVKNVGDTPLHQEARKYKSAEEFVNNRTVTLYHGSNTARGADDMGVLNKGTFLTQNPDYAKLYSGDRGASGKAVVYKVEVPVSYISKTGKPNEVVLNQPIPFTNAKRLSYIDFNAERATYVPTQIPTISQLTDIYNQATGGMPSSTKLEKELPQFPKTPLGTSKTDSPLGTNLQPSRATRGVAQSMESLSEATGKSLPPIRGKVDDLGRKTSQAYRLAKGELTDIEPAILQKRNALIEQLKNKDITSDVAVGKKVNILDQLRSPGEVYKKIGLDEAGEALRLSEIQASRETENHISQIQEWVKRAGTRQEQVFDALDGKNIPLTPDEKNLVGEIREYLSTWADRLKLPKDRQISSYITHIFDEDLIKKEFDPELAKLITDKVPGSVYDPFLQQRLGALGYKKDLGLALSAYAKRGVRKANFDPVLEPLKEQAKKLELSQLNYIKKNLERINLRPTNIDNLIDNFIKSTPIGYKLGQRPTMVTSQLLRKVGYRGTLGGNIGSAMKNLSQGVNTYSKLGEKYTLIGYGKALKPGARKELERSGVLSGEFIQDQSATVYKKLMEKVDDKLFYMFQKAEEVNRGAAYFGAKRKALDMGKSEADAILDGLRVARETQFTFGNVDTPPILASDAGKLLGQFQSFNLKQTEFLANLIKNREFVGMARWLIANAIIAGTVGKIIGYDVEDMVPFSGILTGKSKLGQTPALKAIGTPIGALLGVEGKYGQPLGIKDIGESLVPIIPGGVQAKKTIEGLKAYGNKASTSDSGRVRFPVEQTPLNALRTAIIGQYSSPYARFYFDNALTPLGDTDTDKYNKLVSEGGDPVKTWKYIYQVRIARTLKTKYSDIKNDKTLTKEEKVKQIQEAADAAREVIQGINKF